MLESLIKMIGHIYLFENMSIVSASKLSFNLQAANIKRAGKKTFIQKW